MQVDKEFSQKTEAMEDLQELLQQLFEADHFCVAAWTVDKDGKIYQKHITWDFPREDYSRLVHEFSKHLAADRRRVDQLVMQEKEVAALREQEDLRQTLPLAQFAIDAAAAQYPEEGEL